MVMCRGATLYRRFKSVHDRDNDRLSQAIEKSRAVFSYGPFLCSHLCGVDKVFLCFIAGAFEKCHHFIVCVGHFYQV